MRSNTGGVNRRCGMRLAFTMVLPLFAVVTAAQVTGTMARRPGDPPRGPIAVRVPETPKMSLQVIAYAGVELLLIDPDGKKVGFDGSRAVQEIATASYSDTDTIDDDDEQDATPQQANQPPEPTGKDLYVQGVKQGVYRLEVVNSSKEVATYNLDVRLYGYEFPNGKDSGATVPDSKLRPGESRWFEL